MDALLDSIHACKQSIKSLILPARRAGTNASMLQVHKIEILNTAVTLLG